MATVTIYGITYTVGSSKFKAASAATYYTDSEGHGAAGNLVKGNSYVLKYYASGAVAPYCAGDLGWVKASAFPRATYTIYFDANGGSPDYYQTKTYGVTMTIGTKTPTRTGYTFKGWGTSASATSATYNSGSSYTGNADKTLYAVWSANTYTITFNANGGSGAPSSQTKTYGKTLTLSSTKPTRTGYTFLGWSTSSSATSATYSAGGSFSTAITSNTTLYAVWKLNTYTITYNANNGTGAPSSQTKNHGATLTLSSTKPTRTGYNFLGWSTSSTATSATYSAGGSFTGNANTTLYAVWKLIEYTITFNANGGTGAPANQTKVYGTTLTLSGTKPTKPNYNFLGWATSVGGAVVYSAGSSYTNNAAATLYAVWQIAYIKPRVTIGQMVRCDENGVEGEYTYGLAVVNCTCDTALDSVVINWTSTNNSGSYTVPSENITQNSDFAYTVNTVFGNGELSTDYEYTITVTVTDTKEEVADHTTTQTIKLTTAFYPLDFRPPHSADEQCGVAIGKAANKPNILDIGLGVEVTKNLTLSTNNTYLRGTKTDGNKIAVTYVDSNDNVILSSPSAADTYIYGGQGHKVHLGSSGNHSDVRIHSYSTSGQFTISTPNLTRGTNPPSGTTYYNSIVLTDNTCDPTYANFHRMGILEVSQSSDGSSRTTIGNYKNVAGSNSASEFRVGFDASGNAYAQCSGNLTIGGNITHTWTNIPRASGVTVYSSSKAQYTKIGNHVYIRGMLTFTKDANTGQTIATLPSGYRPATQIYKVAQMQGSRHAKMYVTTDGNIGVDAVYTETGTQTTGTAYWIDVTLDFFTD